MKKSPTHNAAAAAAADARRRLNFPPETAGPISQHKESQVPASKTPVSAHWVVAAVLWQPERGLRRREYARWGIEREEDIAAAMSASLNPPLSLSLSLSCVYLCLSLGDFPISTPPSLITFGCVPLLPMGWTFFLQMCLSMLFGGEGAALAAGQVRIVGLRAVCFECKQEEWGFICLLWRSHHQGCSSMPFPAGSLVWYVCGRREQRAGKWNERFAAAASRWWWMRWRVTNTAIKATRRRRSKNYWQIWQIQFASAIALSCNFILCSCIRNSIFLHFYSLLMYLFHSLLLHLLRFLSLCNSILQQFHSLLQHLLQFHSPASFILCCIFNIKPTLNNSVSLGTVHISTGGVVLRTKCRFNVISRSGFGFVQLLLQIWSSLETT